MTDQTSETNGPEPEINDEQRQKVIWTSAGIIDGMHGKLNLLRDDPEAHNPSDGIDHNVEQAQISLEIAAMRLEQVSRLIADRQEKPSA